MRRKLLSSCLLILACTVLALRSAAPRIENGVWVSRGAMTEGRSGAAAAPLIDGRVLIVGGMGPDGVLASADTYGDFGEFSPVASMNVARKDATATVLHDGRVLVSGGTGSDGAALSDAEIYDPMSDFWTIVPGGMLEARSGHVAVRLQDGRVLIIAGEGSSGPTDTLEIFDVRTDSFAAESAHLTSPRTDHAAALLNDGKVLVAGGSDGSSVLSSIDVYDPSTGSLTTAAGLVAARRGHSATTLPDGRVVIIGGADGSSDLGSAEIYDPASRTSSLVASVLATPRRDHLAFLLPHNGSVLLVGGSSNGQTLSSAELYLPWIDAFQPTGSLAQARIEAAGSALAEAGQLLVAGGSGLTTSELYGFACVMTDSLDYSPGETALITGRGFHPNQEITLEVDHVSATDGNGEGHEPWSAFTDAQGDFSTSWYVNPDDSIGALFKLTAEDADGLHAETIFKDNPKVGSVVVGAQTPTAIRSTVSATYVITVNRGTGSGSNGSFTATLSMTSTLPTGVTASFSPNPVSFTPSQDSRTATLTIGTTSATPAGVAPFTVKAATSTNDFALGDGSLTVDNTGPDTTISSSPTHPSNSASATFTFAGTDDFTPAASLTFECDLDGGGFAACVSPKAYAGLSNASHTFRVRAKDQAGNLDASPATFVWTVDTVAPAAPSIPDLVSASDSGSSATDNITSASAPTFSGTAEAASTVKIFSDGVEKGNAVAVGGVYAIATTPLGEGSHAITAKATDAAGNTSAASGSLTVTIDTTAPAIAPHAMATQEATGAAGAVVNYSSPATSDAVDGAGVAACSPVSGSTFAIGQSTVTCQATDAAGNSASPTTFIVKVEDTTAPVIAAHPDVVEEATSAAGAVVTYSSPATSDAVDGAGVANCSPVSGSTFVLGQTTVNCQATDAAGNAAASTSFVVKVQDTTAPVIAMSAALTIVIEEATSAAGAVVTYTSPTTSDAVDGAGVATCSPASGTTFALGETSVSCHATDAAGNAAAPKSFIVRVQDTTAPVIAAHAGLIAEATSAAGAVVIFTNPSTSDAVDGAGVAICSPASGTTFALGESTVSCHATDAAGNAAVSTSFIVKVQDTTAPVIAAHVDLIEEATSAAGAVVTFTNPSTSDAVDGAGIAICSPASGTTFALGESTVSCHAADAAGNAAVSTSFIVKVQDTTAPVIAAHAGLIEEAASAAGAVVIFTNPSTSDAVDGAGIAICSPASGTTFALGETTVSCHATDAAGNAAVPTSFVVKVQDTTAPVIAAHVDMIEEATSAAGAVVMFTNPSTSDAVDGAGIAICSPASGTTFALGETNVSCHATDAAGNAAVSTSFMVKVQDTTAPIIAAHVDMIEEATSAAGAVVMFANPSTSDAVDGAGIAICSPASGTIFSLGETTVSCHATDAAGNAAVSTSFMVKVQDTTAPIIAAHVDMIEEATSAAGAVVMFTNPSTSDAVDGAGIAICSPASGTIFSLGETTVSCHATDAAGNAAVSTSFIVKVQDTTAPIIAAHVDMIEEASSAAGAVVAFTNPSTSDAVDGAGVAICSPVSGSVFALGETTVTCHATDAAGNAAVSTSFVVKVQDTTAPVIAAHVDMIEEASSAAGAVVAFTNPSTSDAVDGAGVAICSPVSGSVFALGETTVTCHATDAAGNAAVSTSFIVKVQDTTAPVIAAHVDMIEEATSAAGAVVMFTNPSTSDAVDGVGVAICSPASGTTFALGETTVSCHATDAAGNAAVSTSFVVKVHDTTAPVIATHVDLTEEATSASGAVVMFTNPSTSDAVDGAGIATCSPASGTTFSLGETTVSCHASDAAGNAAVSTSFFVKVQDTTAPVIAAHVDMIEEATSAAGAVVTFTNPSTSDAVDGAGVAICSPASGTTFALGETTVSCHASDAAGNAAVSTSFMVKVQDTTAPVIAAHVDMIEEATSASGAVVMFTNPSTSDAVDGAGTAICSPASGTTFSLGEATVSCHASDAAGNAAVSTSFIVKVQDTTAPVIAAHLDMIEEATSAAGAVVMFTNPSTSDAVDGAGVAICSPASGTTFALGESTVSCHATDAAGNNAVSTSYIVKVQDTTPPVALVDSYFVDEDATLNAGAPGVLANDTDFFALTAIPAGGASSGMLTLASDGAFSYSPTANFNGTVTFNYRARDLSNNESAPTTVTITVRPVNDPPTFTLGPNPSVTEDAGAQSMAWATAMSAGPTDEAGQSLNFVVSNDNNALFSVQPAIAPDGSLSFTPAADANGSATVMVELRDDGGTGHGGADRSVSRTFTLTVLPSNDAPSFTKGAHQTVLEDAGLQTINAWATGISAGPANESSQSVSFIATNDNNALFSVQPAVSSLGALSYIPTPNANGVANVTITAKDSGGTANGGSDTSAAQIFTISVAAVNDAPSFVKGPGQSVARNAGSQTVNGWATSISAGPANESGQTLTFVVTNDNNGLFAVQPKVSPNGTLTYTPAATSTGPASATVSVQLRDSGGTANGGIETSSTQTFTIYATYDFTGFFQPVDNLPVVNRVNSGAAVPVKFSLAGNQGADIFAAGYPASVRVNCQTGGLIDDIEATETAGASSLSYDTGSGQYKYVWKTEKSWSNTCRQLIVRFKDGSPERGAMFQFK